MTNAQTYSALFPEKISKLEAIKVMVQSELNSVSMYHKNCSAMFLSSVVVQQLASSIS